MAHAPIVIVGAGLGGLTLARILHANGVESVILELETDRHARVQGGMLDIHDDGGQVALRAGKLHDKFGELILPGAEARRVLDRHATVWFSSGGPGGRPEVERGQLRQMLLDSLPEPTIRWGAKVVSVRRPEDGPTEVSLADGSVYTCDLLIGADGTWSRVRPLLTDAVPAYSGVTSVEGYLYDSDERCPEAAGAVGAGSLFAVGHGRSIMAHREARGTLHFYAWMCVPDGWAGDIDFTDAATAKQAVLDQYPEWAPPLRRLIAGADSDLVARALYQLPAGLRWERLPGVTLLGDAAHVMVPTGDGANLAMQDAADLAAAILDHPGDVEAALAAYESVLFARAEAVALESGPIVDLLVRDPQAPRRFAELFASLEGGSLAEPEPSPV